jgi:hypothetical protein
MTKTIELERENYREIPNSPLGPPRELKRGLAFFSAMSLFNSLVVWWTGYDYLAFAVIPVAFMAGVFHAGLDPAYWFSVARHAPCDCKGP